MKINIAMIFFATIALISGAYMTEARILGNEYAPLWLVKGERCLLGAYNPDTQMRMDNAESMLVAYCLESNKTGIWQAPEIPKQVTCLLSNGRYIFAAGTDGLAAYDKTKKQWERWQEGMKINCLALGQGILWLGTDAGVLGLDISSREIVSRYARNTGLDFDQILSLYCENKILLAGSVGRKMAGIDLQTSAIWHVKLPETAGAPYALLCMYKSGPNRVRLVLWRYRELKLYDYDYVQDLFVPLQLKYYQLDRLFKQQPGSGNQLEVKEILSYLVQVCFRRGLPNHIAAETIEYLFQRGDYDYLSNLVSHQQAHVREQALLQMAAYPGRRIDEYYIRALDDPKPEVVDIAMRTLAMRNVQQAVPRLRQIARSGQLNITEDLEGFSITGYLQGLAQRSLAAMEGVCR